MYNRIYGLYDPHLSASIAAALNGVLSNPLFGSFMGEMAMFNGMVSGLETRVQG